MGENLLLTKNINIQDEHKLGSEIKLILPINTNLLNKDQYEKLFHVNENINKKRSYTEMISKNSSDLNKSESNNNIGKKFKVSASNENKKINSFYSNWSIQKLEDQINKLEKNIDEEISKNDDDKKEIEIKKFQKLYEKWVKISQDAVYTILEIVPQNQNYEKNTIKTILDHFKIDKELIMYDSDEEIFL